MAEILLKMSYKKFDTNDAQKVMISRWFTQKADILTKKVNI